MEIKYPIPNTELYVSAKQYKDLDQQTLTDSNIQVIAFHGPLTFLSVITFDNVLRQKLKIKWNKLLSEIGIEKVKQTLILDMSMMLHVDITGIDKLQEWISNAKNMYNMDVTLASCTVSVLATLERAKFFEKHLPKSKVFLSVHDAVVAAQNPYDTFTDCCNHLNGNK